MNSLKILFVEDNRDQQKIFSDSIDRFNNLKQGQLTVNYTISESIEEVNKIMDGSFDGVILDLKLAEDSDGGNKIVQLIDQSLIRVPIIFVTGYPDLVNAHPLIIKKRARGSEQYIEDIELLVDVQNSGLTNIMGGRGQIEENLNQVFRKNLLPQISIWIQYGKTDPVLTEKALLRYTLNHLLQSMGGDNDEYFPEEVYIHPPNTDRIRTGSIVCDKTTNKFFMVLTPTCDLAPRQTTDCKTDHILSAEIDDISLVLGSKPNKKDIEKKFKNSSDFYHHWLPETNFFKGGFLNFRKLMALNLTEFKNKFNPPTIQISPFFLKDIISRFSSYYSRQGQPDIKHGHAVSRIISQSKNSQ